MRDAQLHSTHPAILKRLKRAEGHLRSVIGMLEEGRSCLDLAQQLHAVERAIGEAKRTLIHDHIDHCLDVSDGGRSARQSLDELKVITKYL